MGILLFNGFLLLGLAVASDVLVLGAPSSAQIMNRDSVKRCVYRKTVLLQADCFNKNIPHIPTYLRTDIQVLDLRTNRVREVTNVSLVAFKSLAFIYLSDNFIQNIEEAAFANQQYLEVLDLAQNGCDNLPKSIFQLPRLRTLYLDHNKFTDSTFKVEVTSPIEILQLAKNKFTKIPDIGFQPTLVHLNMSDNLITSISPEEMASFCMLKTLDVSKNPIRFDSLCECQLLNLWLEKRQIKVTSNFINCTDLKYTDKDCTNMQFSNQTYELYDKCSTIIQQVKTEKARSMWILLVSCISVFFFVVFVGLYCMHKRNRRRRRKQKEQQQLAANNANTELLNSNLTANNS